MQKLLTFFSKNISIYAIFNDQNFNNTLTNDVVSSGPRKEIRYKKKKWRANSFLFMSEVKPVLTELAPCYQLGYQFSSGKIIL